MKTIKFTESELEFLRNNYEMELMDAENYVAEIKNILKKLGTIEKEIVAEKPVKKTGKKRGRPAKEKKVLVEVAAPVVAAPAKKAPAKTAPVKKAVVKKAAVKKETPVKPVVLKAEKAPAVKTADKKPAVKKVVVKKSVKKAAPVKKVEKPVVAPAPAPTPEAGS